MTRSSRGENAVIHIALANEQSVLDVNGPRLRAAARVVFERAGLAAATISLAVVDDRTMRALNRQYRGHDETTDVLSFLLDKVGGQREGEVIVSAETAARVAPQYGWGAEEELLLYVIHGALHLVGYDDAAPQDAAGMQAAETAVLTQFGIARQGDSGSGTAPASATERLPPKRLPTGRPQDDHDPRRETMAAAVARSARPDKGAPSP